MSERPLNPITTYGVRYCHPDSTQYTTGDQLYYLLENGWSVTLIRERIVYVGARRFSVYVFDIENCDEITTVRVVRNPYMMRFVHHLQKDLQQDQPETEREIATVVV
jgi:hypothetical protein